LCVLNDEALGGLERHHRRGAWTAVEHQLAEIFPRSLRRQRDLAAVTVAQIDPYPARNDHEQRVRIVPFVNQHRVSRIRADVASLCEASEYLWRKGRRSRPGRRIGHHRYSRLP